MAGRSGAAVQISAATAIAAEAATARLRYPYLRGIAASSYPVPAQCRGARESSGGRTGPLVSNIRHVRAKLRGGRSIMEGLSDLREEIVRFARSLFERGLTPGSSGNISVRLEDDGWLVTPTNASLGFLDPARLSRLDAEGRLIGGDKPTKEIPLHAAVYDTRAGVGA